MRRKEKKGVAGETYRLEVSYTFTCDSACLRPEKTFLFEDEATAYENTARNGQDDTDDLEESQDNLGKGVGCIGVRDIP